MPHHSIVAINTLIAEGKLTAALTAALSFFTDAESQNFLLLLKSRDANNEKQNQSGTADNREYLQERNKITVALTAFLGAAPTLQKYLTNPPLKPDAHFIGRETELAEIQKRFKDKEMLMLVNGEGGIGKTTLASKYWYDFEADYLHLAYVFCEGDIGEDIRNKLVPRLGIELREVAEEKQLTKIIETMAAMPKPCLLILDNANESKHILSFKDTFHAIGWHVLITSRCQKVLTKEQEIAINHLPPAQAKALFLQHYSENTPDFDSLLDKLLQAVGYNTLCVEIFAKNLRKLKPLGEKLLDLLQDLQEKGMYLGDKSFEIHTQYMNNLQIEEATTDDILTVLYDLSRLTEVEKTMLLRFALLPSENHEVLFLLTLFAPENKYQFLKELIALNQKGWLTSNEDTYRLSPVIQRLLLAKEKENVWKAAKLVVDKVNEKLGTKSGVTIFPLHEVQPYSLVAESLIENIQVENEYIAWLSLNLADYYINIGNFNSAITLLEKAATIYQTIGEEHNYGICLERLGDIYVRQGKIHIAKEYREKIVTLYQKRYEANPTDERRKRSLAIAYHLLGDIYQIEKEYKEAMNLYQKDADLTETLCKDNPNHIAYKNGLAIAYQKIGIIYEKTEDLDNALHFYQKYNQLKEAISQVDTSEPYKNGLAISYFKIGKIFYLKTAYTEALSFYQKYHQLEQELVKANPNSIRLLNGLALSYHNLGAVYKAMNEISVAKVHFEAAEEIWRELVERVPDYVEFRENWENVKSILEMLG